MIFIGDDPSVRMTRAVAGAACQICERAFTTFRWKAGSKGRFKNTVVCQTCARMKNVCQCCLLDLEFGLPVQIRDKYLADNDPNGGVSMPMSRVGIDYQIQQQAQAIGSGASGLAIEAGGAGPVRLAENPELRRIARSTPYYDRNQARLCSFFLKGECTRGASCPYRHSTADFPKTSSNHDVNIQDRFFGSNDPVAVKLSKALASGIGSVPPPPTDVSVTTLFITNVPAEERQENIESFLRSQFERFGNILKIKVVQAARCAFVEFEQRASAEAAMVGRYNHVEMTMGDKKMRLNWARPKATNQSPSANAPYRAMEPRHSAQ